MDDQKRLKILLVSGAYVGSYIDNPVRSQSNELIPQVREKAHVDTIIGPRMSGPYVIAHHLREQGHFVEVLDHISQIEQKEFEEWFDFFRNVKFDVIGVSSAFFIKQPLQTLVSYIKSLWPDAMLMVGGQHNVHPCDADYYVTGFGERAVVEIIDYHFYGKKGLKWMPYHSGKIIDANTFYPVHLDPAESRGYYYKLYDQDVWDTKGTPPPLLEISRGCRFACKFCDFPLIGLKEDTAANVESIYRFLQETYDNFGYTQFYISDDTANNHNQQLFNLRDAVKKLSFTPEFSGMVRADLLKSNPIQVELMAESGFIYHYYGIETFNKKAGSVIGKGMNPEMMKELLINTRNYMMDNGTKKYGARIGLIHGLPYETNESYQEGWDWIFNEFCFRNGVLNPKNSPAAFTLLIAKLENESTQLSAFGTDLAKYGYEILPREEALNFLKTHEHSYTQKQLEKRLRSIDEVYNDKTPLIPWKNQYTNFIESDLLLEKLRLERAKEYTDLGLSQVPPGVFKAFSPIASDPEYVHPADVITNYFKNKKMWRHMNKNLIPFG